MIRKIVRALVLVPLAILIVAFAVANREVVTVSFDPFDHAQPAFSLAMPLYVLILALVIAGVIVGGVAAWVRQGQWRGRARQAETQARELRAENSQLKRRDGQGLPGQGPGQALPGQVPLGPPSVGHAPRLTIPPPAG
jgi:uncharacterized integral membrane protein